MGSDDSPLDADYYIIDDLRHGDLIVAGTDGVWYAHARTHMQHGFTEECEAGADVGARFCVSDAGQ
jgi:hypothetical protein